MPDRPAVLAPGANIIIITVDTLRADHLSPYGYGRLDTPAIADLARDGIVFKSAYTPVPLTLPSHSTIFTGIEPFTHGVRDNGGYYLETRRDTLSEVLKSHGYTTAAFVSTFLLDSRWGLAQGFDHYFDNFPVSLGDLAAMARIQRPGGETWAEARRWLDGHSSGRFLMWLHLFDPHTPYAPPEPFRSKYADHPYDGEIAYVDSLIADLVADLKSKSILERTLIVFLSDHGEGLGQHNEDEHGLLTYDSTLHVPWIMRLPNRQLAGTRIDQPVSLTDVFPTVLAMLGLPAVSGLDGTSREPLLRDPKSIRSDVLYAESFYPRLRFGWSELLSVRTTQYKFIRAPRPELYDYRLDPNESVNLVERQPEVARRLNQILTQMVAKHSIAPSRPAATDPDTARRLQTLGYFSGSTSLAGSTNAAADPKDKTDTYRELMRARRLLDEGPGREGLEALEAVLAAEPNLEPAHRALRDYWLSRGRLTEAEQWLRRALARRGGDARLLVDLAAIERSAKRPDRALATLAEVLRTHPDDVEALILAGEVLRDTGRYAEALSRFARADVISPGDTSREIQIAQTLVLAGRPTEAESRLNSALASDPHASGAHYLLAQIAEQRHDTARAESEYRQEVAKNPWDYRARFNLAMLLGQRGERREQLQLLESIPRLAPDFHDVHFYIAKALLDTGDSNRFAAAIAAAKEGLKLAPSSSTAPLGHYVLSDIYQLQGKAAESQRELALGRELERRR